MACEKVRLVHVADGLAALSMHALQDLASLLRMLCPPLCAAFFPRYPNAHCFAFSFLLAVITRHDECHCKMLHVILDPSPDCDGAVMFGGGRSALLMT